MLPSVAWNSWLFNPMRFLHDNIMYGIYDIYCGDLSGLIWLWLQLAKSDLVVEKGATCDIISVQQQ